MALTQFVSVEGKQLRCGYTTGTCAAGAARCCAEALLTGSFPASIRLTTPAGIVVELEPEEMSLTCQTASCGVRKDGGDDVDVTDGALIVATVTRQPSDITICGGNGVGRVTRPGLDQPVGEAAINRVPRQMIEGELRQAMAEHQATGGFSVTISVPEGEKMAAKTFNPRLGIIDGISILGTSGIVRPMSRQAIVDTIHTELKMLRASGLQDILLSPGNYGDAFCRQVLGTELSHAAQCSNYIGEALDLCGALGFRSVLLVGHIGKLCKVAAGIFDTHSRTADGRREVFVTHAALCGGDTQLLQELYRCPTTDACLALLEEAKLLSPVMEHMTAAIEAQLRRRGATVQVEGILFSNQYGILGQTPGAETLLCLHRKKEATT